MALTFKTPGVYVQEIEKLPPSVAEVETAIPAFIGYTEKAKNKIEGDLNMVPTRITSLLEYETYFGFADNETEITVDVATDGTIVVTGPSHSDRSPFVMHYSMQMYFANGGGPCYITSVGQYGILVSPATSVDAAKLTLGLNEIKKQDEPTLLVFPDATFAVDTQFYPLYTAALEQCKDLQDRFTIIDTYTDGPSAIADMRDEITSDPLALKYGAVYYPNLITTLSYNYLDSKVKVTDVDAPTYEDQAQTIATSIQPAPLTTLLGELGTLNSALAAAPDDEAAELMIPNLTAKVGQILSYMATLGGKLDAIEAIAQEALNENDPSDPVPTGPLTVAKLALENWEADNINAPSGLITSYNNMTGLIDKDDIEDRMDLIIAQLNLSGTALDAKVTTIKNTLLPDVIDELHPFINGEAYLSSYELNNNVLYNRIKAEIAQLSVVLPPSSAVAGVYARTDANRGVWTAPANASLNYTIAPTIFIDNQMQDGMNVTTTGKSVNAIRSFTGRGTLIWGARTLTGNSNEWRYVPVRRFFNFAEESIKKASEPFVFQSNDANTWVKVRGMIENFLTQQWKLGALQGAKAEQAFYVSVGLGQTMTAQDVLEGRMIIEVGMAVVRPAEFIVLKFSHKMPEA